MMLAGRFAAMFLLASAVFAVLALFIPAAAFPAAAIAYALTAYLIISSQKRNQS